MTHGMPDKEDPMYLIAKLLMNSLYGRFGMSDDSESHIIVNDIDVPQILEKHVISDTITFDNGKTLISYENHNEDTIMESNNKMNISIGIAAAITAYARIHMSKFKNQPHYNLYYSDTDSIVIDKPLNDKQVGNGIGLMKLENELAEGVFIAPKVYGGLFKDPTLVKNNLTEFTKVKGFTNEVTNPKAIIIKKDDNIKLIDNIKTKNIIPFILLKSLLHEDHHLSLHQDKWLRSFEEGSITVDKQLYNLKATENKRKLVYTNKVLTGTTPFIIDNKEIVNK